MYLFAGKLGDEVVVVQMKLRPLPRLYQTPDVEPDGAVPENMISKSPGLGYAPNQLPRLPTGATAKLEPSVILPSLPKLTKYEIEPVPLRT